MIDTPSIRQARQWTLDKGYTSSSDVIAVPHFAGKPCSANGELRDTDLKSPPRQETTSASSDSHDRSSRTHRDLPLGAIMHYLWELLRSRLVWRAVRGRGARL